MTVFKEFAVAASEGRFRLINAAALNDAAERCLDVVDAFKVTCSISAEYAVGKNGSARVLKTHNLCAEHIGLDLIPETVAAAALCDGDAFERHASSSIAVGKSHIVIADSLKDCTPHDELVVIHRHVEEAPACLLLFAVSARKVREELYAASASRNLGSTFGESAVVAAVTLVTSHMVLEPTKRQAARTHEPPIEVCVGQRA
ncbi:unknown [Sutterella wadsworthensis CAG:135]|nr:unknown [Sutterella wadsworthensis CAG:135]